ncbi:hypothetical protein B0T17DRAFT_509681 [Bombardia bombarda]|uniref:Uncharacterized protein n=1 Tax=Bombardia bombarda TaxID=252184 RepID=A0AA39WMG6_9PEZI|nr:hypothetical protein B0T17DRAFT_509681 [Bombardia bombarda]
MDCYVVMASALAMLATDEKETKETIAMRQRAAPARYIATLRDESGYPSSNLSDKGPWEWSGKSPSSPTEAAGVEADGHHGGDSWRGGLALGWPSTGPPELSTIRSRYQTRLEGGDGHMRDARYRVTRSGRPESRKRSLKNLLGNGARHGSSASSGGPGMRQSYPCNPSVDRWGSSGRSPYTPSSYAEQRQKGGLTSGRAGVIVSRCRLCPGPKPPISISTCKAIVRRWLVGFVIC